MLFLAMRAEKLRRRDEVAKASGPVGHPYRYSHSYNGTRNNEVNSIKL